MATSPAKQLPMQLVMVYFSGGGVQIFSMGMVAMLIASPFKAWATMNECRPAFNHLSLSESFDILIIAHLFCSICTFCTILLDKPAKPVDIVDSEVGIHAV